MVNFELSFAKINAQETAQRIGMDYHELAKTLVYVEK